MFRHIPFVAAVALTAFAGGALAQETQAQTEDQAAQTETDEGQTLTGEDQLDLGQPVTDDPQLGQRYSKEKIGDWDLACIKTEAETDPCSMLQILNGEDGTPIAEFSLFRISNGTQAVAGATVIVPLETLLPAQLTIAVDANPGKRYNYSFCNPVGCVAQIGLTQADIDAFKKGGSAKISLRPAPAPDQLVELTMSLKGFTASFEKVDVVTN